MEKIESVVKDHALVVGILIEIKQAGNGNEAHISPCSHLFSRGATSPILHSFSLLAVALDFFPFHFEQTGTERTTTLELYAV